MQSLRLHKSCKILAEVVRIEIESKLKKGGKMWINIITYFNLKETPQEKRKILLRAKTEKEANKEANEIAEKWKRELKNEGKKGTIMWHLKKDNGKSRAIFL